MAPPEKKAGMLLYSGSNFFRQRLTLATLSSKTILISNIRSKDLEPGIKEFESDLLKILDKITNGSVIELSRAGTTVKYKPGILIGGEIEHDCCLERSVVYHLEMLVCLAPFCKKPLNVKLTGITNDRVDPSVDSFKHSTLPVYARFLQKEGLELKISSRGCPPDGGGKVIFTAPICRSLRAIQFTDVGKIKRVRGWAVAMRVSTGMAARAAESAKSILLPCLNDVYIYVDNCNRNTGGKSPGFSLCLVAETTNGIFYAADAMSNPKGENAAVPEDVGKECAIRLLREIYRGGCADSTNQSLACLFMTASPQDVSKFRLGLLTPYTMQYLRHIRDFFGVTFKVEREVVPREGDPEYDEENVFKMGGDKVIMTCMGTGFLNLSKTVS